MLAHVRRVRAAQPRVGTRKLRRHLAQVGVPVGRDRLFTWLRDEDALVKRKRRGTFTTYSRHAYAVAPNRLKDAVITGPGQAVVIPPNFRGSFEVVEAVRKHFVIIEN